MSNSSPAETRVVEIARDLIQIPSLTPVTPELRDTARRGLDYMRGVLQAAGARCHWLTFDGGHPAWGYPVDNLYAEWIGDPAAPSLCFIGHTDVVPPGDAATWRRDPFGATIEGDFLFGRGATDMKGAVAAFAAAAVEAARGFAKAGKPPNISLILTTDEEWAAINGTRRVLAWMRDTGRTPTAFIVGEPSSEEFFGSGIKIGRRGSLCGTLTARGVQGHAAYPGLYENPNRALALALAMLNNHRWYDAAPGLPATNFEPVALQSGDFGATAIIPGEARALWNIRFTHHQTPAGLVAKLQELLENPPRWAKDHPDAKELPKLQLIANIETAALPYYSPAGPLASMAKSVIASRTRRNPILDARGGTTDGRFVHGFFPEAEIVEIGLPECGGLTRNGHVGLFGKTGGMHQADECCSLHDLQTLMWCYLDLLRVFFGTGR
jgi:succinyl-diaminopimelate desuccinylase